MRLAVAKAHTGWRCPVLEIATGATLPPPPHRRAPATRGPLSRTPTRVGGSCALCRAAAQPTPLPPLEERPRRVAQRANAPPCWEFPRLEVRAAAQLPPKPRVEERRAGPRLANAHTVLAISRALKSRSHAPPPPPPPRAARLRPTCAAPCTMLAIAQAPHSGSTSRTAAAARALAVGRHPRLAARSSRSCARLSRCCRLRGRHLVAPRVEEAKDQLLRRVRDRACDGSWIVAPPSPYGKDALPRRKCYLQPSPRVQPPALV